MVSDQDLAKGVETLLRQSDPSSLTSLNSVVQQLEAKLGLDLSEKTTFIRDQINLLLRTHQPASASASASTVQPLPPPQHQQQQLHSGVNVPAKGHFTLHHASSQFSPSHSQQQFPPPFTLQPPYHSYDLNFRQPYPPYMPQHQHQSPRGPSLILPHGPNAALSDKQSPKERSVFRVFRVDFGKLKSPIAVIRGFATFMAT